MGLFSKKPGGTFFGNLLRGVASKASGGLLGTGANRIELGQTKTNAQLAAESQQLTDEITRKQQELAAAAANALNNSAALNANPSLAASSVNWVYVIIGVLGAGLIFFKDKIFKKKGF
nr:hypothetical protein [Pedobacter sp. ASV2]